MKFRTLFSVKIVLIGTIFLSVIFIPVRGAFSKNIKVMERGETELIVKENTYQKLVVKNVVAGIRTMKVSAGSGIFTELAIPSYSYAGITGSPKLPVIRKLIEIPVGAVPRIRIISSEVNTINLYENGITGPVIPSQPPVPKDGSPVEFVIDEEAYNTDKFYYEGLADVEILGVMRGVRIARLDISPVQYNPVTNQLKIYDVLEVEITFEGADLPLTLEEKQKSDAPYFKSLGKYLLNYKPFQSANRDTLTRYPVKYVIVSDPVFETQLQPFIEWKTKKGFTVVEAYTDDPAVGNTLLSIKAYLEGLYQAGIPEDPAPSFVLFVGDVNQVPAWTGNTGGHVTDLFYCEYTSDYFPEVYYGRFSAQDSIQLQPQIDKTLQYEQYLMPDPSYLNEVVMVAGMDGTFGQDWANGQINYGTENYFNASHGLLSHTYLYPESGSHAADIRQHVSDGVSYGNYTAHCSPSGWGNPSFYTSHIPDLENQDEYCLLVGNCCSSNAYDANECFGEALLRAENKGALGYIGGSNSTYWDPDYYWGVGVGQISEDPPSYEETTLGAYDRTFHDHNEPFADWYTTQDQMIFAGNLAVTEGAPGSAEYYWEIYCLMGDPSLMVYFSEPPELSVSYDPLMPLGSTSFTITTEPYAYAAISMDGILYGAAIADSNGLCIVPLDPIQTPDTADVVVTKQNSQPYTGTVVVDSPQGPYVLLSQYNIDDTLGGNANGITDYGETIYLDVELENLGGSDALDVSAQLTTEDEYVIITDDYEEWGTILSQTTSFRDDAFAFDVADSVPDQHVVSFELNIQDSTRSSWTSMLAVTLNAPVLVYQEYSVIDTLEGDGNGRLDPGETADIIINFSNSGHSDAYDVQATLFTSTSGIVLNNTNYAIDTLPAGTDGHAVYNVTVSEDFASGTEAEFAFTALSGPYSLYKDLLLMVGRMNALIIDLDQNNNSSEEMMTCFENLGVTADYSDTFPEELNNYISVFVCLGIYPDNTALSQADGQNLADYLNEGGNLYMEGGDTWFYDDPTAVHAMFGIEGEEDGSDDLGTVLGQNNSFTNQMSYSYSGDNEWIDRILPADSAFTIFVNEAPSYICAVANDAGAYRTIGSSFEFGGLDDGDNTKDELMIQYLEFFGIEGLWTGTGSRPFANREFELKIFPNPVSSKLTITMRSDREYNISLNVYNAIGQNVYHLMEDQYLSAGIYSRTLDISGLEAGVYYFILNTGDQRINRKLIIIK